MATFKCNDPIYTVLRNGKVISNNRTPGDAIEGIAEDAARNVCAPECCITAADIALDTFDLTVTTETFTGLSIRITITSSGNTYSTAWEAAGASNTFDLTGLIVEVGGWFNGDTVCVEYSYNQDAVIEACCMYVVTGTYAENDTYQLSEIVTECDGGTFDLVYQNPDGGVTIDPDGEMVVPDIDDAETVFATYTCDGCITELLVLSVAADLFGLRLTFDSIGNVPVADENSVSDWNTFFDLPANGTAFTSVSVTGAEVTLYGGAGITLKASLFRNNANIVKIEDDVDCVTTVAGGANLGAISICNALTTVTLNGVTTVGQEGLYTNAALTTLNMDALTTAGIAAFQGCTSATTFTLPQLTTAGGYCFYACTSATTFTLPELTTAGNYCFDGCTSATTFTLPELTTAGNSCFKGCTSATTFTLPELTTAAESCFDGCTSATTFTLPQLTTAGNTCFKDCTSATTFTLPELTTAGNYCFDGCTSLTTVTMASCTDLGGTTGNNDVFLGCVALTSVTVPTALATVDGGNPDGDLVYAVGTLGATINYI